MKHRPAAFLAFLALTAVAACGDPSMEGSPAPRIRAAEAVDCYVPGDSGSQEAEVYAEGATADSPEAALELASSEGGFGGAQTGLTVAERQADRVLYVLEVEGVVKQAVVVHDGPATEGAGGPGWYVESWATCDYSELPRSFTDSIGLQIWTDAAGAPQPTGTIESWRGPEHCSWQSMTFLYVGRAVYVRAPRPDLSDYFDEAYRAHGTLPRDAVDTGFEREGERLWLSGDGRRAFVGTPGDVELWPRAQQPLGCD